MQVTVKAFRSKRLDFIGKIGWETLWGNMSKCRTRLNNGRLQEDSPMSRILD
jgi:hypothetical protein